MIEVFAPAKINLCLDILKKDSSGYHEIQTLIHECPQQKNSIKIYKTQQNENKHRPKDLANSAIQILKERFRIDKNVELEIERIIPFSSGMGGESSNAAAVLKTLNKLWELHLSNDELEEIAAELGCDVPFFIRGGTQLATHFGEQLKALPTLPLTAKINPLSSPLKNKTAKCYQDLDLKLCGRERQKTELLVELLENTPTQEITPVHIDPLLHNDFETLPQYSQLKKGQHLSGSGPSSFTLQVSA